MFGVVAILHVRQIKINEQTNEEMLEATIPDFVSATWVVLASKENKLNSPDSPLHLIFCIAIRAIAKKGPMLQCK